MAYSAINASETDADSPVNQTLMDKIKDNIIYLYDKFHATTGHAHTGAATDGPVLGVGALGTNSVGQDEIAADSVGRSELKTLLQYFDVVDGASGHLAFDTAGHYGFNLEAQNLEPIYAETLTLQKANAYTMAVSDAVAHNLMYYAVGAIVGEHYVRLMMYYVSATRDEPSVWMLRRKADGVVEVFGFDPETYPHHHPFADHWEKLDPAYEIVCLQLNDSPELIQWWKDHQEVYPKFLDVVKIGLIAGNIRMKEPKQEGEMRLSKEDSPALYHKDTKVISFDFIKPKEN